MATAVHQCFVLGFPIQLYFLQDSIETLDSLNFLFTGLSVSPVYPGVWPGCPVARWCLSCYLPQLPLLLLNLTKMTFFQKIAGTQNTNLHKLMMLVKTQMRETIVDQELLNAVKLRRLFMNIV